MQAGLFNIVISLAMLLAAIPALGVLTAGQWYFSTSGGGVQNRTWITVWLACAILLSLPFTAFSKNLFTGFTGLVLLLVIPTLIGLLALLLVHWRDVYDLWRERKLITSILLLTLLVVLVSTAVSEPTPIAYFLLTALAISTVWSLSSRLGVGVLAAAALLLSLVLVVDALGVLGSHYVFLDPRLKAAYTVLSGLAALLAVIVSALCLQRYLERREGDGNAFLYLLLAGLLWVSVAAVTFRHGALVNATSRASEDHLPFGTLAAGVIAGLLLALTGSSKARKAGSAFMILAPLLLAVSYSLGFRVNGQAITAARADRLGAAIERFHQDTGEYPSDLVDLTPSYLTYINGPLTGRGQTWCYQSGADFYRLGYVYFQRYYDYPDDTPFWEPYYEIKVPYSAGTPPEGEWTCDDELRLYKSHGGL